MRFATQTIIQAPWMVAPCERYTLSNYRLVREPHWMEYRLEKAEGCSVEMVGWKPRSRSRRVNLLEEGGGLDELGNLADGPEKELVKWVSKRGLLGFRPSDKYISNTNLVHLVTLGANRVHGPENQIGYTYEPLPLVLEAARIARSASALYAAINSDDASLKQRKIAELIKTDPSTACCDVWKDPESEAVLRRDIPEIAMSVLGINVGLHREPRTSSDWTKLATEILADLTERCLSSEFTLFWSEPIGLKRGMACGWKIRSHFGGLFLKLASNLRETRFCIVCRRVLNTRARRDARVCGDRCRKELSRHTNKYPSSATA